MRLTKNRKVTNKWSNEYHLARLTDKWRGLRFKSIYNPEDIAEVIKINRVRRDHRNVITERYAEVKFVNTNHIQEIQTVNLKSGKFRDLSKRNFGKHYGVCIHGLMSGAYNTKELNGLRGLSSHRSYKIWEQMLNRVYNPKESEKIFYKDVTIDESWHTFYNFYKFATDPKNNYLDTFMLDKDLIPNINKTTNRIYSPSTCVFLPPILNIVMRSPSSSKGNIPSPSNIIAYDKRENDNSSKVILPYTDVYFSIAEFIRYSPYTDRYDEMVGKISLNDVVFRIFCDFKICKEYQISIISQRLYELQLLNDRVYNLTKLYTVRDTRTDENSFSEERVDAWIKSFGTKEEYIAKRKLSSVINHINEKYSMNKFVNFLSVSKSLKCLNHTKCQSTLMK